MILDQPMDSMKRNSGKNIDSQLWHACAGGLVQIPSINSKVFYFPQGHAEHAHERVEFENSRSRVPYLIPCRVSAINYMADPHTDEVYVKMRMAPLTDSSEGVDEDEFLLENIGLDNQEKPQSFAKTLTQSDANNGGGFSVPRYCAETILPVLDYTTEPPVQTIVAKDMHGQNWKFRHIYRGTPRRHLLTTGWSNFVNHKKLVAGDSIVFLRAKNGDLCVGIRRARKGIGGGTEYSSGWNNQAGGNWGSLCEGYSAFLTEDERISSTRNCSVHVGYRTRVTAASVVEAVALAVNGKPFEVVYYPSAGTPEFLVKGSTMRAALQIQWCSGMRFKMPFETEDSSRISWFVGTISAVKEADPIRWPGSPWRLLEVEWDEPDLLTNVKRVNPWLVELVSSDPAYHLFPISQPRKKFRVSQHQEVTFVDQTMGQPFGDNVVANYGSPICSFPNNTTPGIQGVRQAQFGPTLSEFRFTKLQLDTSPHGFPPLDHHTVQHSRSQGGTYPSKFLKAKTETKGTHIFLFGQLIQTEQQSSKSCSDDTSANSSEGNSEKTTDFSDGSGSTLIQNDSMANSSGSPWFNENPKSGPNKASYGHCKIINAKRGTGLDTKLSMVGSHDQFIGELQKC